MDGLKKGHEDKEIIDNIHESQSFKRQRHHVELPKKCGN